MLNEFVQRICGVVQFETTNGFCERLINLCANNNISLKNLQRTESGIMATVASYDFKRVCEFSKKVNVDIKINTRQGMWYKAVKYKGRWGIAVGIAIFFIALMVSSGYIWDVTVSGNKKLGSDVIIEELAELGIKPGVKYKSIDMLEKKQEALLKLPELAWLTLNRHGSRIEAIVSERYNPPIIKDTTPCDIVASRTGQIKYMCVYEGVSVAGEGYPVKEGDLLVSGKLVDKKNAVTLVHSEAKIIAQVQFDKMLGVDLAQLAKQYTGKEKNRHYINIMSAKLPLFVAIKVKGDYDLTKSTKPLRIFSHELPVSITTYNYKMYDRIGENLSLNEAEQVLRDSFKKYELLELGDCAILKREYRTVKKGDQLRMTVSYTVEQDIAKKAEISNEPIPPLE